MLVHALDPLYTFYQIQSRYLEGKELFVAALTRWPSSAPALDEKGPQVQIQLVARCGARLMDATAYFQRSLLICRELGHGGQVAGRLAGLARVANDQGDYAQAQQFAAEGLTLARALGSPVYLSHLLYCLGEMAYELGDLPAARAYLLEALQVTSATGLLAYLAIALFHYATLLIKESADEPAGATQKRRDALALLMLVQNHPATWQIYKVRAARRSAVLTAQMPTATRTDDQQCSESATLNNVVREILITAIA